MTDEGAGAGKKCCRPFPIAGNGTAGTGTESRREILSAGSQPDMCSALPPVVAKLIDEVQKL